VLGALGPMSRTLSALAIALSLGGAPVAALAADLPAPSAPPANAPASYTPAAPDWIVTVGIEVRAVPGWMGASESRLVPTGLPLFGIRKAGTPPDFSGPRDSLGFNVIDLDQFKFGPAFNLVWQRKASSYVQLNGLGDVGFAVQAGGFGEFWPVPWLRLRGEVLQGFGGETGVTGNVFLDAISPIVEQWRFSAGPRVTFQSTAAIAPYFGITPAQSAGSTVSGLPALPVYQASGGLFSYGAGTKAEYFFNPQWAAHAFVEYQRLAGSAANSPLVTQRGSPNQFIFGLGATYSFAMHPLW
jgi:MipA family protein